MNLKRMWPRSILGEDRTGLPGRGRFGDSQREPSPKIVTMVPGLWKIVVFILEWHLGSSSPLYHPPERPPDNPHTPHCGRLLPCRPHNCWKPQTGLELAGTGEHSG